jgi:hypothetical protein
MAKKGQTGQPTTASSPSAPKAGKPSALLDTCGDELEQLVACLSATPTIDSRPLRFSRYQAQVHHDWFR